MADNLLPYNDAKYQRFNESLDEDCKIEANGQVKVGGTQFQPSRILYEMEPIGYADAYQDFLNSEYERIKEVVYNQYPSCIAYNFRLSEKGEGAADPVRKLLHLKDTWESIVFVLYSIVWGEIRHKGIDLKAAQVLVGVSPTGAVHKNFNTDRLISDALKTKIQNLKAVIEFARANNLGLKCEEIDPELLDKLLALQDIRNDISHHTTPTREEAEAELLQVVPIFKEMLMMTEFLADCKILRFESFSTKCRCEEFNGHFLNKEFGDFDFGANQAFVLGLGQEQLFIKWETELFSLSPFLHFLKDTVGRETYISFFKGKKESKYWFEPITKRQEISFDHLQARFDAEQANLISLIVP
ncbi:hypothetical protein [Pedobacter sp.]